MHLGRSGEQRKNDRANHPAHRHFFKTIYFLCVPSTPVVLRAISNTESETTRMFGAVRRCGCARRSLEETVSGLAVPSRRRMPYAVGAACGAEGTRARRARARPPYCARDAGCPVPAADLPACLVQLCCPRIESDLQCEPIFSKVIRRRLRVPIRNCILVRLAVGPRLWEWMHSACCPVTANRPN